MKGGQVTEADVLADALGGAAKDAAAAGSMMGMGA